MHASEIGRRELACQRARRSGALDELRWRADAGDELAGFRLAETLIDQNRVDEVRARAVAGDRAAIWRLAQHLEKLGRLDEAVNVWHSWQDVADTALHRLIDLLADSGEWTAAKRVVRLLAARSALVGLRAEVDAGTEGALTELLPQLVNRRELNEYEAERIRTLGYRAM